LMGFTSILPQKPQVLNKERMEKDRMCSDSYLAALRGGVKV
jgi:hypothetical protein